MEIAWEIGILFCLAIVKTPVYIEKLLYILSIK